MAHLIPTTAIDRYTAAPSPTTVAAVTSLHTSIRDTLGSRYETFLQGSYKNDTSNPDLNDVDIVAIRRRTTSGVFAPSSAANPVAWETIFSEIRASLEASHLYRGKTSTQDKCINVNTNFNADVVPAVEIVDADHDPIAIYSHRSNSERKNSPRVHYANGVAKHQRTSVRFKPTVRMFKRWVRQRFSDSSIAPSFYVECLIYNFVDAAFLPDAAERFSHIGWGIAGLTYRSQVVNTVAGDKDIFVASEWPETHFEAFRQSLAEALEDVDRALRATSSDAARQYWHRAFNE